VRLFLDVCAGVQYAHQNLVIHRDLKPANILVTHHGSAKLLDFGVAKLTEDDRDGTEPTRFQPRTTSYASPEQVANEPVSTATDVYSLGVILFRLLTRRLPADATGSLAAPPLASRAALETPATGRPVPWSRRLAGDLDRILAKALAPEARERYPTASDLGADLSRFLSGEPVTATAPTVGYRLGRFISRHRVGFFASAAAALALAAALVAALWQADRARAEAERSGRVAGLLSALFVDADPWAVTSDEVTVLDLIERGVGRVRNELADDPQIRLELLHKLGRAYTGLGHPDRAVPVQRLDLAPAAIEPGQRSCR
jgi:serine/threonine-protein kinase